LESGKGGGEEVSELDDTYEHGFSSKGPKIYASTEIVV